MKIVVITDVHANLPALRVALDSICAEGYDALIHVGDAIGIGPYPAETLDLLLNTTDIYLLMGNHDDWLINGLPDPQPNWMSNGEVEHQHWTHSQIDPQLKPHVAAWPYQIEEKWDGLPMSFLHYGFVGAGFDWAPIISEPTARDLDQLFQRQTGEFIFYGHTHRFVDQQGQARYVNPGSLGCHTESVARYTVATIERGTVDITHREVCYDDRELFSTFEQREVPERQFIYRTFFGGRFTT